MDIHVLELQHKQNPGARGEIEFLNLHRQVKAVLQYKAKAAMQRCRKYYYETGDKCDRTLARALQEQKAQSYIPYLVDQEGRKILLPNQIVSTFRRFYQTLYNLPTKPQSQNTIEEYSSSTGIPQLSEQIREDLEAAITLEELQEAIRTSKSIKALGPHGFTHKYYQIFLPQLNI